MFSSQNCRRQLLLGLSCLETIDVTEGAPTGDTGAAHPNNAIDNKITRNLCPTRLEDGTSPARYIVPSRVPAAS